MAVAECCGGDFERPTVERDGAGPIERLRPHVGQRDEHPRPFGPLRPAQARLGIVQCRNRFAEQFDRLFPPTISVFLPCRGRDSSGILQPLRPRIGGEGRCCRRYGRS